MDRPFAAAVQMLSCTYRGALIYVRCITLFLRSRSDILHFNFTLGFEGVVMHL